MSIRTRYLKHSALCKIDRLRRVRCDYILLQRSRNYGVHEAGHERHGRSGEQCREVFLVRRVSQHGVWVSLNTYLPPFTS
jgi:hypothetical protein